MKKQSASPAVSEVVVTGHRTGIDPKWKVKPAPDEFKVKEPVFDWAKIKALDLPKIEAEDHGFSNAIDMTAGDCKRRELKNKLTTELVDASQGSDRQPQSVALLAKDVMAFAALQTAHNQVRHSREKDPWDDRDRRLANLPPRIDEGRCHKKQR